MHLSTWLFMAETTQYQVQVPKVKLLADVHRMTLKYIRKEYLQGCDPMVHLSINNGQDNIRILFLYFKGTPAVKTGCSSLISTLCCQAAFRHVPSDSNIYIPISDSLVSHIVEARDLQRAKF